MNTLIDPTKLLVRGAEFCQTAGVLDASSVPAAKSAMAPSQTVLDSPQTTALNSLKLVVREAYVFAAVTGDERSDASAILTGLLASARARKRVCVEIRTPQHVSAKDINDIDNAIRQNVERLGSQAAQVLVAVYGAHAATDELLNLLNRFADYRTPNITQVILAGLPELWRRLASPGYASLERRLAVRCIL